MTDQPLSPTGNPIHQGNKYYRLTNLPKDKLEIVDDLLRRGASSNAVARKIQEWGFNKDVSENAIARTLDKYRKEKIPAVEVLDVVDPHTANYIRKRALNHVNVLDAYSDMIRIQRERIELALERERQTKFPLKITGEEMDVMSRLLKSYGDLAVKVGIVNRMLGDEGDGPRFEPKNFEQALQSDVLRKELVGVVDLILNEIDNAAQCIEHKK